MVVDRPIDDDLDELFYALSDSTRRDIMRRLTTDQLSVSQLAGNYTMSFAAVQKHVGILERAGLVTKERRGREQLVRTRPDALLRARDSLESLRNDGPIDRMSELLAHYQDPTTTPDG